MDTGRIQPPWANEATQVARKGFTLLEMLVAVAVLGLLIVLVSQLFNGATTTTLANTKRMEMDNQARMIFGLIGNDLSRMVRRSDVDYYFPKSGGVNGKMFFHSEAPGLGGNTAAAAGSMALIGYGIQPGTSPSAHKLIRYSQSIAFSGSSFVVLTGSTLNDCLSFSPSIPARLDGSQDLTNDPNFHVVSEAVFRFDYCFLLKNGTFTKKVPDVNLTANPPLNGIKDVAAIVLAIALLDKETQESVGNISALNADLPSSTDNSDPTTGLLATGSGPHLMSEIWNARIKSWALTPPAGVPKSATASVRVYQRFFYLK